MNSLSAKRYQSVPEEKADGATYTPPALADFVAERILGAAVLADEPRPIRVLDPATGDGALLLSLLVALRKRTRAPVAVFGFDTNATALEEAQRRLAFAFPDADLRLERGSFLDFVLRQHAAPSLFSDPAVSDPASERFDLIIANPPYVRTQILGARQAQRLADAFGLTGRVDLYHAFLIGMADVLRPRGTAGIIVSNRFMTTRGGACVRAALRTRFTLRHVWDLGDTKLFDASVLPAVILAEGKNGQAPAPIAFHSIYETADPATVEVADPLAALAAPGTAALADGRRFRVQQGALDSSGPADAVWRLATPAGDDWLAAVAARTWGVFRDIGKIRVGVKTCADKVFIRADWPEPPELVRLLTTHHVAGRFRADRSRKPLSILYPHEVVQGQRQPVDLTRYPKSRTYLESHRATLEARTYVIEGGRRWYEIWVPQNPAAWEAPKLVFRDISVRPTFWLDLDGSVVNGDCYWLTPARLENEALLWLAAAVANSTFAEAFYDHRFNNKLYAGRRRFITQYVEQFPLPDPTTPLSREIIAAAKAIYDAAGTPHAHDLEVQVNRMIWSAFGLSLEEVRG